MRDEEAAQPAQQDVDELDQRLGRAIRGSFSAQAVRVLAEQLVSEGWTKLESGEHVISNEDAILLAQVKAAVSRWNSLKKTARKNRGESAEVSADVSELTSGVKAGSYVHRILNVFRATARPIERTEVFSIVENLPHGEIPEKRWGELHEAFRELLAEGYVKSVGDPAEGEIRRYQLTQAGRSVANWGGCGTCDKVRGGCDFCCGTNTGDGSREELSSPDTLPATDARPDKRALILAAYGSCTGPEHPTRNQAIVHVAGVGKIDHLGEQYNAWVDAFTSLVDDGLLEKVPSPEPGRFWRYTLTGFGVEALDTKVQSDQWSAW